MKDNPTIQIFIPVYNGEKFISDCIQSLLNQTFEDFSICVVDNNSNDNTIKLVKSFKDSRIYLFQNEKNLGSLANFNKCIKLAKADYFVLLPHDDILDKDYIKNLFPILKENKDIDISFGATNTVDKNLNHLKLSNIINIKPGFYDPDSTIELILNNFNPITHPIVKLSKIKNNQLHFNPIYCNFSDIKLWTQIIHNSSRVYVSNKVVSFIRFHSNSGQIIYKYLTKKTFKNINENIGSNNYLNFILRNNYNNGFLNYLIYISQFKKFKYDLVLKKLIISNLRGILYALKNIQYENTYVEFRILIKILAYFPIFKNVKLYFILFCKSLFHLFFKILRLFNRNKYS